MTLDRFGVQRDVMGHISRKQQELLVMELEEDDQFAWRCGITTFLSAFLLFQVQPLISKMILPWFGGSPAVWTTCMLFFQTVLLLGYLYAYGLARVQSAKAQLAIHVPLLLADCAMLPITRAELFKPTSSENPTFTIVVLLAFSIGLPYLTVSTTGPLVQTWFARVYSVRSPYRLYAVSNIGSLAALLSYPVLVEPRLTVYTQGLIWSWGFAAFALMNAWLVISLFRRSGGLAENIDSNMIAAQSGREEGRPGWPQFALWLLLPALASMMLLAITNQLCQNVAVVPWLWIAPLSLYLLSFIICFGSDRWHARGWYAFGSAIAVVSLSKVFLAKHLKHSLLYFEIPPFGLAANNEIVQIAIFLAALFFVCMVCHGEVARTKPPPRYLASFYLTIAAGGVVGGSFVALVCPHVFSTYFEISLGLIVGLMLAIAVMILEGWNRWLNRMTMRTAFAVTSALTLAVVVWAQIVTMDQDGLHTSRNFYGVMTVKENASAPDRQAGYMLVSGAPMRRSGTLHGLQLSAPELRNEPTLYYTRQSGVGIALRGFPRHANRHVGVIGLGVGTVAVYGQSGDTYRFYEINPLVKRLAYEYFSFLEDSPAGIDIVLGDARVMLEREPPQHFDILVLDAFTGDVIPTHLLTREAFAVYLQKQLKPDGVLAVHVSSRYLNLVPVVVRLGSHFGHACLRVQNSQHDAYSSNSDWVLITRNQPFLNDPSIRDRATTVSPDAVRGPLWTDQYNNLFQLVWKGRAHDDDDENTVDSLPVSGN